MTSVAVVTSTSSPPASPSAFRSARAAARRSSGALAVTTVALLILGACGGDDDDDADTTPTVSSTLPSPASTTTVVRATSTTATPTTTTTIAYVTKGAKVVVANASGINGAAGRLTDRLKAVGFGTGEATNASDTVGQLGATQIYYDPDSADAKAVAESLKQALGGGDIELKELGVPAPVTSGDIGDATVLVLMGNDVADKSLEELQGLVPPSTTTEPTADDTGDATTGDATTGD